MIDATKGDFGVSAAGKRSLAGMSPAQREAHVRMASLPRTVHERKRVDRAESAKQAGEKAARTKLLAGTHHKGPQVVLEGSRPGRRRKA